MPNILRQKLLNANKGSIHIGSSVLPTMEETDLEHLVQWSDMLVYDYLTGNYDRVSSMQVCSVVHSTLVITYLVIAKFLI